MTQNYFENKQFSRILHNEKQKWEYSSITLSLNLIIWMDD